MRRLGINFQMPVILLLFFIFEMTAWFLMDLKGVPTLASEMQFFFPGG